MARCRKCGRLFDARPGAKGMYCLRDCDKADKLGKDRTWGNFDNLGLGPRIAINTLREGTWERDNIPDIIPAGD